MEPQPAKYKFAATLMLGMLDCIAAAPPGSSVVCGGAVMHQSEGWTPEKIADKRRTLQEILDAPDLPDKIWHDRIPKKKETL